MQVVILEFSRFLQKQKKLNNRKFCLFCKEVYAMEKLISKLLGLFTFEDGQKPVLILNWD